MGPTTFCCNPFCVRPIFASCSLVLIRFRLENQSEPEDREREMLRSQSPFLSSLYFCGPWCVDFLMQSNNESCLKLKDSIVNSDIRFRNATQWNVCLITWFKKLCKLASMAHYTLCIFWMNLRSFFIYLPWLQNFVTPRQAIKNDPKNLKTLKPMKKHVVCNGPMSLYFMTYVVKVDINYISAMNCILTNKKWVACGIKLLRL